MYHVVKKRSASLLIVLQLLILLIRKVYTFFIIYLFILLCENKFFQFRSITVGHSYSMDYVVTRVWKKTKIYPLNAQVPHNYYYYYYFVFFF